MIMSRQLDVHHDHLFVELLLHTKKSPRPGLEVARSLHSFFQDHDPAFKKTWGGFPPVGGDVEAVVCDLLPGGNLDSLFFHYVKAWWPFRDDKNVLMLHYSDMVKDLDGLVRKLAAFLEVSFSTSVDESAFWWAHVAHPTLVHHLLVWCLFGA